MAEPPFHLDVTARITVVDSIVEASRWHGWNLITQTVQSDHVHVIVCADASPKVVLRVLKMRATTLLRARGLLGSRHRVWTRSGSVILLSTVGSVDRATAYVDAHPH